MGKSAACPTEKDAAGAVSAAHTYHYKIVISREGYEPMTTAFSPDDWQRLGPGNRIIPWPGLDLVPKPETAKENFYKAMLELHCILRKDGVQGLDLDSLVQVADAEREIIRLRNAFKTEETFVQTYEILTCVLKSRRIFFALLSTQAAVTRCGDVDGYDHLHKPPIPTRRRHHKQTFAALTSLEKVIRERNSFVEKRVKSSLTKTVAKATWCVFHVTVQRLSFESCSCTESIVAFKTRMNQLL